jgi:sec-independent protein translocase protein TatA
MGDLFTGGHMIVIGLVILLLFGGKKIPELMHGLGKGIREFKDAKDGVKKEIEDHLKDEPSRDITSTTTTNKQVSGSANN